MIPKKIHYCWLSGEELPLHLKDCISSWKKIMPDYEIVCWDKDRFNIESISFVSEAFKEKKWAFAADYIRLHALYSEGGIYLDTDVLINKSFNEFLNVDFFSSVEYHPEIVEKHNSLNIINLEGSPINSDRNKYVPGIGLQAAVMGSVKNHPFLNDCINWYKEKHFILPNGTHFDKIIAPAILAKIAESYGFIYKDQKQILKDGMVIFPSEIFAGDLSCVTNRAYAIHLCNGSWRTKPKKLQVLKQKITKLIKLLFVKSKVY